MRKEGEGPQEGPCEQNPGVREPRSQQHSPQARPPTPTQPAVSPGRQPSARNTLGTPEGSTALLPPPAARLGLPNPQPEQAEAVNPAAWGKEVRGYGVRGDAASPQTGRPLEESEEGEKGAVSEAGADPGEKSSWERGMRRFRLGQRLPRTSATPVFTWKSRSSLKREKRSAILPPSLLSGRRSPVRSFPPATPAPSLPSSVPRLLPRPPAYRSGREEARYARPDRSTAGAGAFLPWRRNLPSRPRFARDPERDPGGRACALAPEGCKRFRRERSREGAALLGPDVFNLLPSPRRVSLFALLLAWKRRSPSSAFFTK